MRYSNEPLLWALFSAGGMILALLLPVLIVLTGFVLPAEEIEFSRLDALLGNILVQLAVLVFAFLTLMHWANRFRHTLVDMGAKPLAAPIGVLSYLVAIACTVAAAIIVLG
jgi:fumarate reductase subunit D